MTSQYPDQMNVLTMSRSMAKIMGSRLAAERALQQSTGELDKKAAAQAVVEAVMPVQATAGFYIRLVQQGKDPAYYGEIVTPDQPDLILMRWKIEDNQYRVIFSDLTAETVTLQRLTALENALPRKDTE